VRGESRLAPERRVEAGWINPERDGDVGHADGIIAIAVEQLLRGFDCGPGIEPLRATLARYLCS
jgi:hypothetical protein